MRESAALLPGATFQTEQLLAPEQALVAYLARLTFETRPVETVSLDDAFGRVLARDAVADDAYPSHPRSTMDGYAIVAGAGPKHKVVGEIRMGHPPPRGIAPGEALRIPTGGVLPEGADRDHRAREARRKLHPARCRHAARRGRPARRPADRGAGARRLGDDGACRGPGLYAADRRDRLDRR